jgi:hypothetical protein
LKSHFILTAIALVLIGIFLAVPAFTQEKKAVPNEQEKMALYAKYAQPGEHHKYLEPLIGSWDCTAKMYMDPSAPPQESKATCETKWVLGGRFVYDDVHGDMNGMPFEGMGFTGYDNLKEEYNSFWIDESATSFMISNGNIDPTHKIITMTGSWKDPAENMKVKKFKSIARIVSNDQHVYEMYETGPDGKEMKTFEITYNRKK